MFGYTMDGTSVLGVAIILMSMAQPAVVMGINFEGLEGELLQMLGKDTRTIDGRGNNLENTDWGAADTTFIRKSEPAYDGAQVLSGADRPDARNISNIVIAQNEIDVPNDKNAADMLWQWGQFLDHDMTFGRLRSKSEPELQIDIPSDDTTFDTGDTKTEHLDVEPTESIFINGVREQVNSITAFIDASNVYGSDEERAEFLRADDENGSCGLLKVSEGDLLPYNREMLFNLPHSEMTDFFIAGDARSSEVMGLAAMHTLWVREHNTVAKALKKVLQHHATCDQIYNLARRLVGALMQQITYSEFVPLLLGKGSLSKYAGYDPLVNPSISNEFATVGFRVGHTMLSPTLPVIGPDRTPLEISPMQTRNMFFQMEEFKEMGIEPLLSGLAAQTCQNIDVFVIDDVRDFLFRNVHPVSLDLPSLNIMRGRDHGIVSYNALREAYGLSEKERFEEISSDPMVQRRLSEAYNNDIDKIDPWVGCIAEDHYAGAMVGELAFKIMKDQFERLRDGDRFYFENDLSGRVLEWVKTQTLSKVITRNTGIKRHEMPLLSMSSPWMRDLKSGNPRPLPRTSFRSNAVARAGGGCASLYCDHLFEKANQNYYRYKKFTRHDCAWDPAARYGSDRCPDLWGEMDKGRACECYWKYEAQCETNLKSIPEKKGMKEGEKELDLALDVDAAIEYKYVYGREFSNCFSADIYKCLCFFEEH